MSQTLSKGYKLPQTGDFGNTWFPDMQTNITHMNDHEHNGVDGARVKSVEIEGTVIAVASGAFVDQGDGYFRATAAQSSQITTKIAKMRDPSSYEQIHGRIEKASSSSVYIYLNTPQDVEVIFGV